MPQAIGNNVKLGYIPESTWGVTPGATPMTLMRFTGITPTMEISDVQSQELVTAREIQDYIKVDAKGGLQFNHEFSYGNLDDPLQSLFGSVWAGPNVLTVGSTLKSHAVELALSDISQFALFSGAIYNSFSVSVQRGKIVDGSMGFVSKFPVWAGASVGVGGPTAAPTNAVMDPLGSVQLIQEGGSGAVATPTECSINITNSLIQLDQLSSVDPAAIFYGQLMAQGTFTTYLPDRTYIDKFINWTDTSLTVTLGGSAAKKYAFLFNKIKISKPEITGIGVNNAIIVKYNWKAKVDATNTTCKITRTP